MVDLQEVDRTFHFIMQRLVAQGQAPHYTEIAKAFSVPPEEGRRRLHALMNTGLPLPIWLYPGTDLITSFSPFHNLPTQYRLSVDGHQKWFAQWGLEALAVCWLFPGKAIVIDAPCLDCGDPVRVQVRDGVIERREPRGIYLYVDIPIRDWSKNLPHAWSRINLFRSEGHARNWSGFQAEAEAGLLSLDDSLAVMGTPRHRERLNGHYVSSVASYSPQFAAKLREVTRNNPFWDPTPYLARGPEQPPAG